MLLKKQEKNNVIKAMYSSTNILASIYNKENNDLTLIFDKGGQYKYPNVKPTDYTRFELAESQGKVFNSHIKTYSFERLPNVNPEAIIKEITTLREAEQKALVQAKQLKIYDKMTTLLSYAGNRTEMVLFTKPQLDDLQEAIAEFLTESISNVEANS